MTESQGDGVFKVRKGSNSQKLIQIWFNSGNKYLRDCSDNNETITFIQTCDDDKNGFDVRLGKHLEKIINMPKDTYGWYRRFTEDDGERIIFQKV